MGASMQPDTRQLHSRGKLLMEQLTRRLHPPGALHAWRMRHDCMGVLCNLLRISRGSS